MRNPILKSLLVLIAALIPACSQAAEYSPVFKPYYAQKGALEIAIRKLADGGKVKYLVIDPYTFEPSLADSIGRTAGPEWRNTPYAKALERYSNQGKGLQDSGLKEGHSQADGVFLTVDLCPSKKPVDMELFKATMDLPAYRNMPVPVALAVTGSWMDNHKDDMDWVLEKVKEGRLNVTWVNHSMSHPYEKERPLEENFLLSPGVDFEKEVLGEEQDLISKGALPSPFFRFPGLVADARLLKRLRALSLIPIGSDAWLAKGEVPKKGSIILVHGNGNEPQGIKDLLDFYKKEGDRFRSGDLKLLPLSDALK